MSQYKNIITDFKDLRKVIGEITKKTPAKTRYQQQAEKMGYTKDKTIVVEAKQTPWEFMQDVVKKKSAMKYGSVTVDMFTASAIVNAYKKVNNANKKKIEKGTINQLITLSQKVMGLSADKKWGEPLKGFPYNEVAKALNAKTVKESKMGDLLIDIQQGATAKELSKYHNISIQTAKNFLSDYYASKNTRTAPGLKKESKSVNEMKLNQIKSKFRSQIAKFQKGGDLDSKAEKELLGWAYDKGEIATDDADDADDWLMTNVADKRVFNKLKEENLQEGTWAVPDSYKKLYNLQVGFLAMKKAATELNSRKLLVDLYGIFGDDSLYDDVEKYIDTPDPKFDLRDLIVKHLTPFGLKFNSGYKITHAPKEWIDNLGKSESKIEERLIEGMPRRGRGNIKKPKGKMVSFAMSKEDKLKEQKEHAQQSPFKLKSQQYPRAIAIDTDGYGRRHATVEDIVSACDSFGMIIDKELQVEQIQKQLGKKGFISYKKAELQDVFEGRETERLILALESTVEDQEPIKYTQGEISYAQLHEHEIEFLKPDGTKSKGPILKMSGKTFNVKDKYTGKSFTYKYSKVIEEERVKTFKEVSQNIQEVSIGPATIRKDFPNVWAQKDNRMNNVLMALVNLHGYIDNLKAYKKDKKGFVDGLRKIGKNDASLKKAGLTKRNIGEDIQEGRFSKQLIKQAGGIAFDKRYYMGNMTGAINAIEKLKKGLSDDPKVQELLRLANESTEPLPTGTATDYTNWLPEGGDKEAYQKFFNAALKKFGVSSPDELEGDKKKEFFDYVDKNWKGDHEEVDIRLDGRKENFREKMRKLGYIKGT